MFSSQTVFRSPAEIFRVDFFHGPSPPGSEKIGCFRGELKQPVLAKSSGEEGKNFIEMAEPG
jgi:hypothetical protein